MLLAAELFETIVASLNPGRAAAAATLAAAPAASPLSGIGGGLRQGHRIPVATRLTVIPFAPGAEGFGGYDFPLAADGSPNIPLADPVSVPVRDLSRGGVRFLMPRRLPLDTPFVLLLPPVPKAAHRAAAAHPAADARAMAVECSVIYWQPIQRDLFAVGAQFVRVLPQFAASGQPPAILLPGFGDLAADVALRPAV
jgi:hypothetical protein